VLTPPETRYAYHGDFALAYQIVGEGPDLLYLPGWVMNVEANWLEPDHARFLQRLASFSRLVVMDRRNNGCSDRLTPGTTTTMDDEVEDVRIVTRSAHCVSSSILAVQEGVFLALSAAARHPDRYRSLILFGGSHTWLRSEDAPWQWSQDQWEDMFETMKGPKPAEVAEGYIRNALPSYASDRVAVRRMATMLALTQSPGATIAESARAIRINLKDVLPTIRVPTLVLHRTHDPVEPVESGRYLAEHIPDAKLVELPGRDALPWVGESEAVLDEIERFLTGSIQTRERPAVRHLTTVLFTDVVGSTEHAGMLGDGEYRRLLEGHHRAVRAEILRHGGTEVDTAGDGFLITFDSPAGAVACALSIRDAVRRLGIEIRAGVHTGEVGTIDGKVGGIGLHIGARVSAAAGPSEVLVTSTVKELVAGGSLRLEDVGEFELKGVAERWRLFRASS
jgi:class 3 adenylate cyclase